jgi:DNA-binding NarL/FixJ family response regulator
MKVLIADDHHLVRALLRSHLEGEGDIHVVAEAGDGRAALKLAGEHQPDVILLDISMPGLNGLEALPRLRQQAPQARVLILSMHHNEEYVVRAFKSGAMGYIFKDSSPEELITALRRVAEGERYMAPPLTVEKMEAYLRQFDQKEAPLERLTLREREVLQLIAEGHSTQAIAQILGISPKTVETHRANLMDKLGMYDVASLTRFALRVGLVR